MTWGFESPLSHPYRTRTTSDMSTETLQIEVASPSSWARRLTITVPASRVDRQRDEVTKQLAKRLNLPGFRKGKIPPQIIQKRFGPAIDQELVERVIGDAYKEAIEQQALQPITQGAVEEVDYKPGQDLIFHVGLEVRPDVQLDRIGGFTVAGENATVGDAEVDSVLDRLRQEHALWEPIVDGTPSAGDMVAVQITPLKDDEPEEARPYRFVMGEGQAVEDVEDALRTLKPGTEGEFTILTAAEEGEEREEQRVRIVLEEAKRPVLPEANDEFAKSLGEFDSIDALRDRVRQDLSREAEQTATRTVRTRLLDAILDANPFDVPESMVTAYLERAVPADKRMTEEQAAEIRASLRPAGERAVKRMLVMDRIAETEGLHATQDEVDQRVESMAEKWGRSPGEVWSQLQKSGRLSAIEEEITEDKVFEYLLAQSTVEQA